MIEKHVISLGIAKRLHELGVKKPNLFWWGCGNYNAPDDVEIAPFENEELWTYDNMYRAYTTSELLEILPKKITGSDDEIFYLVLECDGNHGWHASYSNTSPHGTPQTEIVEFGETPQEALAKLLICLIENKLMEIK